MAELIRPILDDCVRAGIVIVGNFGVANPLAAARVIKGIARELGIHSLRIAIVSGDDLRGTLDFNELEVWEGDRGLPPGDDDVIAANVYIGAKPIADAISAGAQVVVTGRVADPSLALGPLVAHYGWAWDDWDRLARGTLAGHLLECGSQITGGYFADPEFKDVPSPENIGFPIAEIELDGSLVITKAEGTGGLVTLATVKEQILYEMHDPESYITPDVILDITRVEIQEVGPDRVTVRGARGRPAPQTLKATVGFAGDWLGEAEISYAGPNALARARLAIDVVEKRLGMRGLDLRRRFDLIGAVSVFDSDNGSMRRRFEGVGDCADIRMRLAISGPEKIEVEKALQEVLAL